MYFSLTRLEEMVRFPVYYIDRPPLGLGKLRVNDFLYPRDESASAVRVLCLFSRLNELNI
jgi:hypothetical protein